MDASIWLRLQREADGYYIGLAKAKRLARIERVRCAYRLRVEGPPYVCPFDGDDADLLDTSMYRPWR